MRRVYLIAFRGVGFSDMRYEAEHLLIRSGHVGFYFEGEETLILGFRPTQEASAQ